MTNNNQEATKRYFMARSPFAVNRAPWESLKDGAPWGIKFLSEEIIEVKANEIEEAFTLKNGNYFVADKSLKIVSLISGNTNETLVEFDFGTTMKTVREKVKGLKVSEDALEVYIEDYIDAYTHEVVRYWDGSNFRALWLRTEDMQEYFLDKDMQVLDSREKADHCLELRVGTEEGAKKYFFAYISYYQKDFFTSLWEISEEDAKKVFEIEGN